MCQVHRAQRCPPPPPGGSVCLFWSPCFHSWALQHILFSKQFHFTVGLIMSFLRQLKPLSRLSPFELLE